MRLHNNRRLLPQFFLHAVFLAICFLCVYPLLLVLGISFTDEAAIAIHGYNVIPAKFSCAAYDYMFKEGAMLVRAYGVTIGVTIVGTLLSTFVIALYAYPLSRPDFRQRKFFTRLAFFTMLFSGGLVPWYMVCANMLHLTNTCFALFVPYLMNAWYVMIMRTFYRENVSVSLIESAMLDGASEYTVFFKIVIHLATPGIATIALFNTIGFWNDWWLPFMLVNEPEWFNLQYLMFRIQSNIQYLSSVSGNVSGVTAAILERLPSRTAQMAMCVLVMGPIVLAYPLFQNFFVKGLTVGSIKE